MADFAALSPTGAAPPSASKPRRSPRASDVSVASSRRSGASFASSDYSYHDDTDGETPVKPAYDEAESLAKALVESEADETYARITRELAATTLEATPEEDAAPEDGADEESVEAPVEAPDEDYAEDPAEEPIAGHLPSPGCVVRVPLGTSNASATSSTGTGTSSAKPSMPGSAPPKKGNVTARINAMLTTKN